jgi:hypothetical protein
MSHQIGGAFSLPWQSRHDKNNWLARGLRAPFVGLGGLGFVFWLGLARAWCVTIPPIRAVLGDF